MAAFTQTGVELVAKGSREFFRTMGKASGAVTGFGKTAAKAALAGTAAVGAFGVAVGVASVKAAVSFESAFAGVIKTTDGLTDGFGNLTDEGKELQDGFRGLAKETPIAVEELLAIGELGGQLGIAREDLLGFTETIAAMGVATNLTTEDAAVGFAQLANIMGTPQDQISNMGSSVVALGNNFATTERDIFNFASRIAGAGQIVGLTEPQVFAIGAAMTSVGVQAEAGGTAVQKVLLGMNTAVMDAGEELDVFAATAGLSAEQFAGVWETNAGLAFNMFVQGLGTAGDDALLILQELGLEDQRLIRSFLSLAGASDVLAEAMVTSDVAFAENVALAKEAEQRYATTESQFQLFKNTINDLAITIGQALLPFLNQLLQAAGPLIEELGRKLPGFLNEVLIPAIQEVGKWLGENIPKAISFAVTAWTQFLQPALKAVWSFITNDLIPTIEDIVDWLSENIPEALDTAADFWENVLLPAMEDVSDFVEDNIIPVLEAMVDFFEQDVMPVIQDVADFIVSEFQKAVSWVQANWPLIQQTVQTVLDFVNGIIQTVLGEIEALWATHGDNIMSAISLAWETIKETISAGAEFIRGIIEAAMLIINGKWDEAWELIKDSLSGFLLTIIELVKTGFNILVNTVFPVALDALKAIVNNGFRAIRDIVEFLLEAISTIISSIWDDVKANSGKAWEAIKNLVGDGLEAIKNLILNVADAMVAAGKAIVEKIKEGIESAWGDLVNWFKDKLNDLTDLLPFSEPKDPTSPLYGLSAAGEAIVNNLADGIVRGGPAIVRTASEIGAQVSEALIGSLDEATEGIEELFGFAGAIGGLGNIAAKRLGKTAIDPLQERLDGLNETLEQTRETMDREQKEIVELLQFAGLSGMGSAPLITQRLEQLREQWLRMVEDPAEAMEQWNVRAQLRDLNFQLEDMQALLEDSTPEEYARRMATIADIQEQIAFWQSKIDRTFLGKNVEEIDAQINALEEAQRLMIGWTASYEDIATIQERITESAAQLAEEEARILKLEQARENLKFLEQQFKLLELIQERGLDPTEILAGLQLGLDANLRDVVDAMTRAMEALVTQAEEELGIASPSKVAIAWGENLMGTLAMTIEKMAALPVRASILAAQEVAAAPMLAAPMSGAGASQTQIDFHLGGNTFNTGSDEASFQSRTLRTVMRGMEGKV